MSISSRWLPVLAACAALSAGCTPASSGAALPVPAAPEPAPPSSTPLAPATTEPAAVAPEVPPAPEPRTAVDAVGDRLALAWCLAGGTSFSAFGTPDALSSCKEIGVHVSETRTTGQLTTAIIELSIDSRGSEERRYVYLQTAERLGVFELAHGFSSGIGGFSHSIALENVQLRDVHGDETPEWSAEIVSEEHDADMGMCAVHGRIDRDFILCTVDAGGLACLDVPVSRLAYDEHAEMKDDECGPKQEESAGYTQKVSLEKGSVRLSRDPQARFTDPSRPPYQGRYTIAGLLGSAPAKRSAQF